MNNSNDYNRTSNLGGGDKMLIYMVVFVVCGLLAVAKDDLERP
jgi:hypothetical protein|tara:strand:+ start:3019 stop:3147 length:129 start_codon:yes stop_codon:yes gene_type:complete